MRRYKFYICAADLIFIAQGAMSKVRFYPRKPEQCQDTFCDINQLLEVFVHIPNPIKDAAKLGKNKKKSNLRKSVSGCNRRSKASRR